MTNRAEIVITALDKASAVINRIADRMDALGAKSNIGKAWERLGNSAAMEKVGGALSKIGGNLQTVAGYGSVAAGAVAGVFSTAVNSVDDFADAMANAGIKGKQLVEISALRDYLVQFGVSSEDSSAAMLKLTGNISAAAAGNKEAQAAFAATGISMDDLKKKAPTDVLMKMMDSFSQSDKAGAKLKVLQALAGKSSVKMAEGLSQGVDKYEDYKKKAQAALLTEKDFDNAGNAADSMTRITGLIGRAAQKMAAVAAPKLQAFLDRREAGLLELIPKLVDGMERFINSIDEKKVMGFFEGVGEIVSRVAAAFRWLADNTSTTTRVVLLLGVAFAPSIAALFSIGSVALPLVIGALKALGAAALANPFMLVIAAIAAGVYLIYQNWDGIVAYFSGVWGRVKAVFEVNFFDGLIQLYLESWQMLGNGILGIIKSIPLVRDLDIVKNMSQLDFASRRAEAVAGKAPATAAGAAQGTGPSAQFGGGQTAAQLIGGGGRTEVGGRIQVEILGAPTKVRQLSSNNSAVPIDVSAGLYGVGS
jgi:hypothetical protein